MKDSKNKEGKWGFKWQDPYDGKWQVFEGLSYDEFKDLEEDWEVKIFGEKKR